MKQSSIDWEGIKAQIVSSVNILTYCQNTLHKVTEEGPEEIKACCPFHDENNPSFYVNQITGLYFCQSCGEKGSLFNLQMHLFNQDFKEAQAELAQLAGVELPGKKKEQTRPPIDPSLVKGWAARLLENKPKLDELKKTRGLSDDTIEKARIGWDGFRYTIPIYDAAGRLVNVRRYDPSSRSKMIHYVDGKNKYGSPARLYGAHKFRNLKNDTPVVVCEGEFDRLVLEQAGLFTVTSTHGCKSWLEQWSKLFKDRPVAIIMDADEPGRKAAKNVILPAIAPFAKSITVVDLPFDPDSGQKDISDWFLSGRTAEQLFKLIRETATTNVDKVKKSEETKEGGPDFEISRVLARATDPVSLELTIGDQIMYTTLTEMMVWGKFRDVFFRQLKRVPHLEPENGRKWPDYAGEWLNDAEWLEVPPESTPEGELREMAKDIILSLRPTDNALELSSDIGNYIYYDYQYVFSFSFLRNRINNMLNKNESCTQREMTSTLHAIGCTPARLSLPVGKKKGKFRVWIIPNDLTPNVAPKDD